MYPLLNDDLFLYKTPEGGILFYGGLPHQRVNSTGAGILELCDGSQTVDEICQKLSGIYNEEFQRIKNKVESFLNDSKKRSNVKFQDILAPRKYFVSGNSQMWVPHYISLELTKKCDLNCIHCYAGASITKSSEISPQKWLEVLSEFYALGTLTVNLTGGDPFSYEDIFAILDYCEGRLRVAIPSNGFRIDDETVKKLTAYDCIDHIQISLDGPDSQTHDAIRGRKGSFEKAINAIELLSRKSAINLFVAMVILPQNEEKVEDTIKLAKSLGAKAFGAGKVFSVGRAKDKFNITKEKFLELDRLIIDLSKKYSDQSFVVRRKDAGFLDTGLSDDYLGLDDMLRYGDFMIDMMGGNCGAGCKSIFIKSNGDVIPCSMMDVKIGNILEQGVKKTLANSVIQDTFRIVRAPNSEICKSCENNLLCMGCNAQAYVQSENNPCNWRNTFETHLSNNK